LQTLKNQSNKKRGVNVQMLKNHRIRGPLKAVGREQTRSGGRELETGTGLHLLRDFGMGNSLEEQKENKSRKFKEKKNKCPNRQRLRTLTRFLWEPAPVTERGGKKRWRREGRHDPKKQKKREIGEGIVRQQREENNVEKKRAMVNWRVTEQRPAPDEKEKTRPKKRESLWGVGGERPVRGKKKNDRKNYLYTHKPYVANFQRGRKKGKSAADGGNCKRKTGRMLEKKGKYQMIGHNNVEGQSPNKGTWDCRKGPCSKKKGEQRGITQFSQEEDGGGGEEAAGREVLQTEQQKGRSGYTQKGSTGE